jgi:hypothetical protein
MPRRSLAVLLPLLACLLAACGGGSSGLSLDPVAAAATKTIDTASFRVSYRATMNVQGQSFSFAGRGAVDSAAGTAEMAMNLSGLPVPGGSAVAAKVVFAGGVMYMNMPLLAQGLPHGKTWVKLDVRKAASAAGFDLDALGGLDPKRGLNQLLGAGNAEKIGTETIRGEETTHYRAVVDLADASGLPPAERKALEQALKGIDGRLPVDVWIDGSGRVVREAVSFDYGAALGNARMAMTMDFSDFGAPVAVTVPAASDVADITHLLDGVTVPTS